MAGMNPVKVIAILILVCSFLSAGCRKSGQNDFVGLNEFRQYVRDSNVEGIQHMIEQGYDANSLGYAGENALHEVFNADVAQLLIDKGADVNNASGEIYGGATPLHIASMGANIPAEVVRVLLNAGANRNTTDSHDKKPIDYAKGYEYEEKVGLLKGDD